MTTDIDYTFVAVALIQIVKVVEMFMLDRAAHAPQALVLVPQAAQNRGY